MKILSYSKYLLYVSSIVEFSCDIIKKWNNINNIKKFLWKKPIINYYSQELFMNKQTYSKTLKIIINNLFNDKTYGIFKFKFEIDKRNNDFELSDVVW